MAGATERSHAAVGEGIGRQDQLVEPQAFGCGHGQGFPFSPPVSFAALAAPIGFDAAA